MDVERRRDGLATASLLLGLATVAVWVLMVVAAALMIPEGRPPVGVSLVMGTILTLVGPLSAIGAVVTGPLSRRQPPKADRGLVGLTLGYTSLSLLLAF